MSPTAPERLRDGRDIAAVLRGRRQRAGRQVVLQVRPRDDAGPARIAVIASRRVGGAVQRNRAKRLLREAVRRFAWPIGIDVVLIARASCARSDLATVHAELQELVDALEVGVVTT